MRGLPHCSLRDVDTAWARLAKGPLMASTVDHPFGYCWVENPQGGARCTLGPGHDGDHHDWYAVGDRRDWPAEEAAR